MTMRALLHVDLGMSFFEGGALGADGASAILPGVNAESADDKYDVVVACYETHRLGNRYLAETYGLTKNTLLEVDGEMAMRWVLHSMDGTDGAKLHPDFDLSRVQAFFRKGYALDEHPLSAFGGWLMDGQKELKINLRQWLIMTAGNHDIEVTVDGLLYCFCAGESALDSAKFGFKTRILKKLSPIWTPETEAAMTKKLLAAGVEIVY